MTGDWFESTNQAAGQFFGSIKGNRIDARIEGQTFAALLNMTTMAIASRSRSDRREVVFRASQWLLRADSDHPLQSVSVSSSQRMREQLLTTH